MELNKYQQLAMSTCMPSCDNFSYMMLNLVGEVGAFASKVAKAIRKNDADIIYNDLTFMDVTTEELQKECGDILWQIAGLSYTMGWDLEDIAQMNLDKLASRRVRGVIDGNGDNR